MCACVCVCVCVCVHGRVGAGERETESSLILRYESVVCSAEANTLHTLEPSPTGLPRWND